MKRLIGWLGRAISYGIFKSPFFLREGIAWGLAALWFDVFRIRRGVVLNNLLIAFPDKDKVERTRIARGSLRNLALSFIEYSFLPWLSPSVVDQMFTFEGLDLFEAALSEQRGVLLLTLHMGNGDLGTASLAVKGYPMVMVSKSFKLKWLNDFWFGIREDVGMRFVPARNSSYALLKALKRNQAVIIPLDQFTGPPIGVRTTFFGKETGTAAGLAIMAARSKAPVLSVFTVRQPDGRHLVKFVRRMATEGSPESVTQGFNDELEKFVRDYPDQWMWLHKRWKTYKF